MQLLVSATNLEEAKEAREGGADILDVKNPREGSLGANFPWIIRQIADYAGTDITVSTTIGDVPYKPATVSLAALGAAYSGSNYIKVGLHGPANYHEAREVMENVVKTIKEYDESITTVACGYADSYRTNSVNPLDVVNVAIDTECDIAMLDTYIKDKKTLTDHLTTAELEEFVQTAHSHSLKVALAGSVNKEHIPLLKQLKCDIIGVRGCVCTQNDRNNGTIKKNLVRQLKDNI